MTSPYSTAAEVYREQGLSVIPCAPGTKFPGRYSGADGWWKAHDWQRYCDRQPTDFETSIWDRWPDAGVCLALGSASAPHGKILVGVDIDTDDPTEVAAIRSVLPGSPVKKRGAKGETEFYLANPCVKNQPFNDANKRRLLDLLCHGRQTVMPPTVHPDCQHCGARGKVVGADMNCSECGAQGQAYRWITPDTLDNFDVADLPMLPDDIAAHIGKALEPFGYTAPPVLGARGDADLGIEAPHRALNDAALQNLDAWIPDLKLYKIKKAGAGYKAVADWRPSSSGRPDSQRATNLAIRYDGIKDCGENKGYTPLDLVMAALGTGCDLEMAFRWLQERVAPQRTVLLASNPSPKAGNLAGIHTPSIGNLAHIRLAAFMGEAVSDARLGVEDEPANANAPALTAGLHTDEDIAGLEARLERLHDQRAKLADIQGTAIAAAVLNVEDLDPLIALVELQLAKARAARVMKDSIIPAQLCTPPGLVGELTRWVIETAARPQPQLALGATLAFLGALMGRRFESPSRLRTNVYCVGLAPTGFGKSHALEAINSLAMASGLVQFFGPEKFLSDSAVRSVLQEKPTCVCLIDELGGELRGMLGPRAPEHKIGIRDMLLALFSRAASTYHGAARAAEKAVPIINPNLCIYGASTPSDLFKAFTEGNVDDGFLPRWLVFNSGTERVQARRSKLDVSDPPLALSKALHAMLDVRPAGNLNGVTTNKPIRATWGPGAEGAFAALQAQMEEIMDDAREAKRPVAEAIASRYAEHVGKLALIYAVGINPKAPVMTTDSLDWASAVVHASKHALVESIEDRVAENDKQREYLKVRNIIRDAGQHGMTIKALLRQIRGSMDERRFDEVLRQLTNDGSIWRGAESGPRGGRPAPRVRALAGFTDADEEEEAVAA